MYATLYKEPLITTTIPAATSSAAAATTTTMNGGYQNMGGFTFGVPNSTTTNGNGGTLNFFQIPPSYPRTHLTTVVENCQQQQQQQQTKQQQQQQQQHEAKRLRVFMKDSKEYSALKKMVHILQDNSYRNGDPEAIEKLREWNRSQNESCPLLQKMLNVILVGIAVVLLVAVIVVIIYTSVKPTIPNPPDSTSPSLQSSSSSILPALISPPLSPVKSVPSSSSPSSSSSSLPSSSLTHQHNADRDKALNPTSQLSSSSSSSSSSVLPDSLSSSSSSSSSSSKIEERCIVVPLNFGSAQNIDLRKICFPIKIDEESEQISGQKRPKTTHDRRFQRDISKMVARRKWEKVVDGEKKLRTSSLTMASELG